MENIMDRNSSVAVFIDVENIHYSALNYYSETPDWSWVVDACKEYGRISSIQAFGDWIEFSKEVPEILKNGIQPVFVPLSQDGKSSLDCYLTVSAMKLFFQNDAIDTLILASGDRDYMPLIAELRALGKEVVILAVPESLSKDLTTIVDKVIPYKPRYEGKTTSPVDESVDKKSAFEYVISILTTLEKDSVNNRWVNLAKLSLSLKRKDSTFTHTRYGYRKLVEMLDDIPRIELKYDNYEKTVALARTISGEDTGKTGDILTGEVFRIKEGYGFIKPDTGRENVFFHCSKLANIKFEELREGDKVTYSVYNTERGLNAENINRQNQQVNAAAQLPDSDTGE
jgi:uncharacterized protein (TIGR00288 family)